MLAAAQCSLADEHAPVRRSRTGVYRVRQVYVTRVPWRALLRHGTGLPITVQLPLQLIRTHIVIPSEYPSCGHVHFPVLSAVPSEDCRYVNRSKTLSLLY